MLSIRAELKKGNRTTILNAPCNNYGIDIALQNLGETDMTETEQFCMHIGGGFRELSVLEDRFIYIDELNFLAKYLDSLTDNQRNQFRAAMFVEKPTEIKEMINLAANLHNYTLITDFSNIDKVGRTHRLNVETAIPTDDSYDYAALGESLLTSGKGVTTPYGVLFVNGLPMHEIYNGETFPEYLYEDCQMIATIGYDEKNESLYLPCAESAIDRAVHRLSASGLSGCELLNLESNYDGVEWLESIVPDYSATDLPGLNKLCAVLTDFSDSDIGKLVGVCDYACVSDFEKAAILAENLDSFEYAPFVDDEESLGKYLIQSSGSYEYDDELEDYYDYESFGSDIIDRQNGKYIENGYVGIKDDITLADILGEDNDMNMKGL